MAGIFLVDFVLMYCTITYMKTSLIATAEAINWSEETLSLIKKVGFTHEEVEEIFLNLPSVKRITVPFPDNHERLYIEGMTDRGKKARMIIYISKKKIHITY